MTELIIDHHKEYQNKILKGFVVAVGFLAFILSILNVYLEQYSLTAIETALAYACWFVYQKIQSNELTYLQSLIVPYFVAFIVIFGTAVSPLHNGLFIWTFILPTIFYLLYGKSHGFWASLIIILIQISNILLNEHSAIYNSERIAINFALAYVTIWVVSAAYEMSRQQSQIALQELATKDYLTGAYNLLALKKHYTQKQQHAANLTLVLIDIDFFKKINDCYGHETGDHVLLEFTKILQKQTSMQSVFRLDGEEFCLLLDMTTKQALAVTESIKNIIERKDFKYKENSFHISFSAGISDISRSLPELLADADKKLYQAKNNGRNQIVSD